MAKPLNIVHAPQVTAVAHAPVAVAHAPVAVKTNYNPHPQYSFGYEVKVISERQYLTLHFYGEEICIDENLNLFHFKIFQ